MCAIKKIANIPILFLMLAFMSWGQVFGQKNGDIQRIEDKLDSVLLLLKNDTTSMDLNKTPPIESIDCSAEVDAIEKVHQEKLNDLDAAAKSATKEVERMKKENSSVQKELDIATDEQRKNITSIIQYTMKGGVSIGEEAIDHFLSLAKSYKTENLKDFEAYVVVFKEVKKLQQDFDVMIDFDKVKAMASGLHSKTYKHSGLKQDVIVVMFKLNNYCDYEQKLMDAIALSKTQSSEDNRKKQLLRREDDFNDYPSLLSDIEKIKANKEHQVIQKCNP